MILYEFLDYGVAIFLAGVLAYAIKLFLGYMEKKDKNMMDFMTRQEDSLTNLMKNHLNHNTDASNRLIEGQKDLSLLIRQLLDFIKRK